MSTALAVAVCVVALALAAAVRRRASRRQDRIHTGRRPDMETLWIG